MWSHWSVTESCVNLIEPQVDLNRTEQLLCKPNHDCIKCVMFFIDVIAIMHIQHINYRN